MCNSLSSFKIVSSEDLLLQAETKGLQKEVLLEVASHQLHVNTYTAPIFTSL